jgi:hypothetical protein
MVMLKRMSVCKCTLTEAEENTTMIKVDARALRLVCHNFATFSRAREAADSSYRGFVTVDVTVPNQKGAAAIMAPLEIRCKYRGTGLNSDEAGLIRAEIDKIRDSSISNGMPHSGAGGLGSADNSPPRDGSGSGRDGSGSGENSRENSGKGLESFGSKILWQSMAEGKTLIVAYLISEVLGGKIEVKQEFGFVTLTYSMSVPTMTSETTPKQSPEQAGGSIRKARMSPNSTPPAIPRKFETKSNNVKDIVDQFPISMKICALGEDVEEMRGLCLKELQVSPSAPLRASALL